MDILVPIDAGIHVPAEIIEAAVAPYRATAQVDEPSPRPVRVINGRAYTVVATVVP